MSLSPIGPSTAATAAPEVKAPAAPAAPDQTASASLKSDTVSISSQGHAAASAGDVDHDGDSH